jgi:FtsH-binding integral membrane protein
MKNVSFKYFLALIFLFLLIWIASYVTPSNQEILVFSFYLVVILGALLNCAYLQKETKKGKLPVGEIVFLGINIFLGVLAALALVGGMGGFM